jgi:hypothetical protein
VVRVLVQDFAELVDSCGIERVRGGHGCCAMR